MLMHGMGSIPNPQKGNHLVIFHQCLQWGLRSTAHRGEHVYDGQLVYRLLRIGLKLGKVDHHSMPHTSISVMCTKLLLYNAFVGVDAQKQGF